MITSRLITANNDGPVRPAGPSHHDPGTVILTLIIVTVTVIVIVYRNRNRNSNSNMNRNRNSSRNRNMGASSSSARREPPGLPGGSLRGAS